ncbi:MSMEG_4193 family putative phosphomutase [Ornithinicoccus halotolerans]|uniref:MSMEG_4193 family putative phosphomutase n=1 Tax=Ornithinicoccus halotolerans TaxID=1748220 RepID=UPI001295223B|nr:MSMEG_4193 family putative phosphomutase [Ornithinicoccus halotolerans]
MTLLVLTRHGRSSSNADGTLAGWTPGVDLDDTGREQARALAERLAGVPLVAVVSSPLLRCRRTAEAVLAARPGAGGGPPLHVDDRLGECRYGAWTGRRIEDLAKEPLWRTVQDRPSAVTFPPHPDHAHESLPQMSDRAVAALRDWDQRLSAEHGPAAAWLVVSHGDVLKALLADALGMGLDRFQRLVCDPASVSVLQLTPQRPTLLRLNDTAREPVDLSGPARALSEGRHDAVVGGGSGSGERTQ